MLQDYLEQLLGNLGHGNSALYFLAIILLALLGALALILDHRRKMLMIEKGLLKIKIYRGLKDSHRETVWVPGFSLLQRIPLHNRGLLFPGFILTSLGAATSLALYLPFGMGWWMTFGLLPLFPGLALMLAFGLLWI